MTSNRAACIFVFLALLSGQALPEPPERVAAGQRRMPGSLDFRLYQDYLIVVEGNLGGLGNQNLLLDTGTDSTILDKRIARKLQLKLGPARVDAIGHDVDGGRGVLATCQVGPITCRNYNVLVQDLSFLERGLGAPIDAIIGLDILSSVSFTVDYRRKRILFGVPESLENGVAFESGPPLVTVIMTLNGRPTRLLVDTGASSLMLFKKRWLEEHERSESESESKETFFPRPKEVERLSSDLGGELMRQMTGLKSAALGGVELGRQTAFLVEHHGAGSFAGLLSPTAIGLKELYFDFEHKQLGWSR
ncbi:MAG: aspartyl protease family protein [Acidobacteria bacterium]|nr:aspartyl protease family protein [Acidobacteriota bacterium]